MRDEEVARYEITCSECQKVDQVPFKPRTGHVLCRECFREMRKTRQFDIICIKCGTHDQVPFKPRSNDILCSECHDEEKKRHIPRKAHNTRVTIPIVCCVCEKPSTLDYIPKNKAKNELMCKACAGSVLSEKAEWQRVQRNKIRDENSDRKNSDRKSSSDEEDEMVEPGPNALIGAKPVANGVHKRRRTKS